MFEYLLHVLPFDFAHRFSQVHMSSYKFSSFSPHMGVLGSKPEWTPHLFLLIPHTATYPCSALWICADNKKFIECVKLHCYNQPRGALQPALSQGWL